jgi:uncharacterized protein YqgQ
VDQSRSQSGPVRSAAKTESPKTDTTFSSGTRQVQPVTTVSPVKTQTVRETKTDLTPPTVRTENQVTRQETQRTETGRERPEKTAKNVNVAVSGSSVSETAKPDRRQTERTERPARPERSEHAERSDGQSVVTKGTDRTSSDSAVRLTRDDLKDRAQRISTDQIRQGHKSRDNAEPRTASAEKETIRQRVVTRIDRSADRDSRRPEGDRRTDSVIQASEFGGGRDRHERSGRDFRPQTRKDFSDRHISRAEDYTSQIVINGNKNVVVVGDVTNVKSRPYVPRTLYKSCDHVRHSHGWVDCGSYFSLSFSLNSCGRIACVPYGGYYGFTYYYPRYHRRYVFVSLGGWWPCDYRYVRYYWYGCHPYYWYGPTVVYPYSAPVVNEYNTYNTYNYYQTAPTVQNAATESHAWKYPFGDDKYDVSNYVNKISAVDEPEFETAADLCFAQAVELFTAGKYEDAAAQFREAVRISPNDIVLPFTYSQALFANEEYARAAAVLRAALAAIPDDQLTIYYPRGLYDKEEYLMAQIAALEKAAEAEPFAGDYNLLLGYQYLGIGDLQKAASPLAKAAQDPANEQAAAMLIELAAKIQETPADN